MAYTRIHMTVKILLFIKVYYRQVSANYIKYNKNLQSGAGVPPTLIHYYFSLITSPKIDPKD